MIIKFITHIFVFVAWLIPGKSHRWAKKLKAERKAMLYYSGMRNKE